MSLAYNDESLPTSHERIALIAGSTGIVGYNLAQRLSESGWQCYGLARHPRATPAALRPVAADLRNPASLREALSDLAPTHVFIATWLRQPSEAENCIVNGTMVTNLLEALDHAPVQHCALVTGLKHYMGSYESYGAAGRPETPFREDVPRLTTPNFYYDQEDALFAAADHKGFSWSVHRPHSIIGRALSNVMNMGTTLAVYASLCRELDRPFRFPGSEQQWNGLVDVTDAGLLAHHLAWASTAATARNQGFNVVNGDVFRWSWMWDQIAAYFSIQNAGFDGNAIPLDVQMREDAKIWSEIAVRHELIEPTLARVASPWHTDINLGRSFECVTSMSKSRAAGFDDYVDSRTSFYNLFDALRRERVIP